MHDWVRNLAENRFPKGPQSQGGQDGILAEIFRHVPTVNDPPFGVEFGFNATTLDGGSGANMASLVLDAGWQALLLDGEHENSSINLRREFLTSANIGAVLAKWSVPSQPDYISIDVDSTDLWLFRALLSRYQASVYSVEYNCNFPLEMAVSCADDPSVFWRGDRLYGASLRALYEVAREYGYSLVAVEPQLDAFFIRDDLLDDGTGALAADLKLWRPFTGIRAHPPVMDTRRLHFLMDYIVWRDTGGDLVAAKQAAVPAYKLLRAGALRNRVAQARDRLHQFVVRFATKAMAAKSGKRLS